MIPVDVQAKEIDTLPGEEVQFTIGNAQWVMKSLSKLYSNSVLATIREYSTNAYDAHVEAKNDAPIEVTVPTSMYDRVFVVQDFGVGMSTEELKSTYTRFGDSTKRGSNDFNGMLGFGSKAALAYTDSFTVESVKDGFKTSALIARKPDWTITLKVLSVDRTDESNGTKVTIPVADYRPFEQIARDFYRFWPEGTVKVNGSYPQWAVGEKLDDNLYYSKSHGTSYVVMGNVGYRIVNAEALFHNRGMNAISFVAYVPNGSVEFTPSREDLEYTDLTKKTLYGVIENFEKKMLAQAQSEINSAKDYFEAYEKYSFWVGKLGKRPFGDLEFKGEKFIDEIPFKGFRYRPSEYRYNMFALDGWQVSQMVHTMIVTGLNGTPSSHHKGRAKSYRDQFFPSDMKAPYILFTDATEVKSVWVDQRRVVDWETVKEKTKPARTYNQTNRPKRIKGTFDFYTKDGLQLEKELPDTNELYYITVADSKTYHVNSVLSLLEDNGVVVRLAVNRVAKFKRDNPQVKSFVDEFKSRVDLDGVKFIDDETKAALKIGRSTREWLKTLPLDKIKDPEFAHLAKLLSKDTNAGLKAYERAYSLAYHMGMRYNFKEHNIYPDDNSLVEKSYPLLNHIHRFNARGIMDDLVVYINAKFESKKGN